MLDNDFNELVESIKEAGAIKRGLQKPARITAIQTPDVLKIRKKLHRSQIEFAHMIGVSVATLRNWEQHRRVPVGPARALLTIVEKHPEIVEEVFN